jgi:hypothetical protein
MSQKQLHVNDSRRYVFRKIEKWENWEMVRLGDLKSEELKTNFLLKVVTDFESISFSFRSNRKS